MRRRMARCLKPFTKLAQHAGVVVVRLLPEERIHVGVGVEHDAHEQVGMLAGERGDAARRA